MLTPNQASKLVARGRMKSISESWTEEEAVAINNEKDSAKREALIAKLRGEKVEKVKEPSENTGDKVFTPEEIRAEKERVKAEKKAEAKAKKEAVKKATSGKK